MIILTYKIQSILGLYTMPSGISKVRVRGKIEMREREINWREMEKSSSSSKKGTIEKKLISLPTKITNLILELPLYEKVSNLLGAKKSYSRPIPKG